MTREEADAITVAMYTGYWPIKICYPKPFDSTAAARRLHILQDEVDDAGHER